MDEPPASPFDDYTERDRKNHVPDRRVHLARLQAILRALSWIAFSLAIGSAFAIIVFDLFHLFTPFLESWRLKSAFPLLFVGISYGCLQFTLKRSWKEFVLGVAVGIAFILWGVEQFVPYPAVVSLIDDAVMFVFVFDLSILIRGHLLRKRA